MAQSFSNGLGIDDVYLNVNLPQAILMNGATLFNALISGAASWGPFNTALVSASPQQLVRNFGPPINSGKDIVQDGVLYMAQRAQGGVIGVRVGDGTQTKAGGFLVDTAAAHGLVVTAYYHGSWGKQFYCRVSKGSNWTSGAPTAMVSIFTGKNQRAEVYDNILMDVTTDGTYGVKSWLNIATAVNAKSTLVVMSAPGTPSVLQPDLTNLKESLAGGSDGITSITTSIQMGTDGGAGSRTGLYAGRQSGFDMCWLAGSTDTTAWAAGDVFAQSEGGAFVGCITAGDTVTTALSDFLTAAVADANFFCGWGNITYLDTWLNAQVTLPATPVIAGICARMNPSDSPGNQQAFGILKTNLTGAQQLSFTDMTSLKNNGILFLNNPIPSGAVIGLRHGKNTSTNTAINEITYTRKLNQILRDLGGPVLGQWVNKKQTTRDPDPTRSGVMASLTGYFSPQKASDDIDDFSVQCDLGNNSVPNIQAGRLTADVVVEFMSVVNQLIINITAGQTVTIQNATQAGQVGS